MFLKTWQSKYGFVFDLGRHDEDQTPDDDQQTDDKSSTDDEKKPDDDKKLSQDEVNAIVTKRLARERKAWEKEQEEKRKKEQMTAEEKARAEREEAQRERDAARAEAAQARVEAAAERAALAAGVDPKRVERFMRLVDLSDESLQDEGKPDKKAIEAAIASALEDVPEFKREGEPKKIGNSSNPGGTGGKLAADMNAFIRRKSGRG